MMMRHYMFWRFLNGRMGLLLLGLLIVVGIVLLIVFLASRKHPRGSVKAAPGTQPVNAASAATASAALAGDPHTRILDVLRVASEEKQASAADFEERRMVLDGGKYDNYRRTALVELKEKYARFELSTQEYIEARAKLLNL